MCDGHCHCCCGKHRDQAGEGIGALLALLLAGLGLMAYAAYWLALMVVDWLSAAASVVADYQIEILCIGLAAILLDLCLVTRRLAGHAARLPWRRRPVAVRSTLSGGAPRLGRRGPLTIEAAAG